jgi:hypothetical protein
MKKIKENEDDEEDENHLLFLQYLSLLLTEFNESRNKISITTTMKFYFSYSSPTRIISLRGRLKYNSGVEQVL